MPALQTSTLDRVGHKGWSLLRFKDPTLPLWIGAALLLVFLMLFPLVAIFRASMWDDGGFTLNRYLEVFTNEQFLKAIWNSLIISTWVGAIAVVIGALLAWLVARTDLPWKKPIRALVMASFVTPPFLGAFAWTLLAGPNAGALNKLYRAVTGSEDALFNIFSMPGLIFVMALYSFPYVFSMIANVCELISSDLEDAAEILGANKWWTAWTVTLPLALPALIGGFILAFLQSLSLFGAPAILGLPAGLHTITTQIWALFQYPPRLDMAAAFSVPLLLATMVLIAVQKKILGRKGYSTVGGKGGQKRLIRLGWGRVPVLLLVLGILSLSVFLPYWILLKAALSKAWALPLTWDNFTLKNFSFTFLEYGDTQRAIYNTFKLGLLTATHRHAVSDSHRLHYQSQSVSRRALSQFLCPGASGDSRHRLGGRLVHRLFAAAFGALRHDLDSFRGFFNQRNADRVFPGGVHLQEHSPGARRCQPDYRRQPAHVPQRYNRAAGALGTDRRLVFYLHRRHPRAQRRHPVICAELESGVRSHFRS